MIKKILSAVICLALVLSVMPAGLVSASDSAVPADELVDFLMSLGIYGANDNMIYGNETINREDLASILSVFYGVTEESYPVKTDIPDVMEDWSSGHIKTLVDMGILTRYTDGLFRPKDNVTVAALCKIFVTMTGYDFMAEAKGGYPNGYIKLADELDILDGVSIGNPDAPATREQLTAMLCNTLSVPLLELASVGDSYEYEKDKNRTLLTESLSVYKAEGRVTALPYVSLSYGDGAGEGMAVVGNTLYKTDVDLYEHLGAECEIYFRQSKNESTGTILYASRLDYDDKDVIEIKAEDVVSYSANTFRYYDGDKIKTAKIPTNFMLIFNGKRLTNYKVKHLTPPQGRVRLCDTDGNRNYDKVIVDYEVNYRVSDITIGDDSVYITDIDHKDALMIGTDGDYWYEVFKKGKKCDFKDININDVLSIVAEDIDLTANEVKKTSRVYRINVSDSHFSGNVTSVDKKGIYVDDVYYYLTDELLKNKDNISLGDSYTFYLNYIGEIAAYEEGKSTLNYGLILDYSTGNNGFEDTSVVRIFTQDGVIVNYDCTDKLRLDGKVKKNIDNFTTVLKKSATQCQKMINEDLGHQLDFTNPDFAYTDYWQVVKYSVSDSGKLLAIDTVADNVISSSLDLKYYGATDSDFTWVNPVIAVNGSKTTSANNPQKRYTLKDGAILFAMEKEPTDEKHFLKHSTGSMHQNEYIASYGATTGAQRNIACILFDADDMNLCQFMLVAESGIATGISAYVGGSNYMLFEGTRQKRHTDGDTYDCIFGTHIINGTQVTVPVEDISLADAIKPGDWIRWNADGNGVAYAVRRVFGREGTEAATDTTNYLWRGRWSGSTRLVYARVEGKSDTHIMLRFDDEAGAFDLSNNFVGTEEEVNTFTETLKFPSSAKYFIYDTETNTTKPATKEDIRDYANYGEDADMIAAKCSNATLQTVVIYR